MIGSNLPPADTNTVFAILRLLADPKAAEAKLKGLVEADAKNALKLKTISEHELDIGLRENALATGNANLDAKAKTFDDKAAALAKRESEFNISSTDRSQKLSAKEEDLAQRERSLQARTEAVNNRESKFDEIETRLATKEKAVNERGAFYESRIQQLKTLTAG